MPFNPKALRGIRAMLDLTQKDLASLLEVTPTTIHNWEHEEAYPSMKKMDEIYLIAYERNLRVIPDLYAPPKRKS